MWSGKNLKAKAQANIKNSYGGSVLASFLRFLANGMVLATCIEGGMPILSLLSLLLVVPLPKIIDGGAFILWLIYFALFISTTIAAIIIAIPIHVFVTNPISVGCSRYFLSDRSQTKVSCLKSYFIKGIYKKIILTMFLRNLFIFLWSLLFIIPGIYKSYQYRMVPYLLAEDPHLDHKRALNISTFMMEGEKQKVFKMDLSFFFLNLASIFLLAIPTILYIGPYRHQTNAELYKALHYKIEFFQYAEQANN